MHHTPGDDPILKELEQRLPTSGTDPRILSASTRKVQRLREWLRQNDLDGVLISRRDDFAWLTTGGDNHVLKNTEIGVGHLLVARDRQYLLAYTMDGPRLMAEQVSGQGYELVTVRWHQDDPRTLAFSLGGARIAADAPLPGMQDRALELSRMHEPLEELEMERLRWLGRQTGLVFEQVGLQIKPGMTEWDIARLFTDAFTACHIELDVLLVGSDERAVRFRHVIPTPRRLERYVLINPSARRWGLHANVSRGIHFGPVKDNLRKSYDDAAGIVADLSGILKPGLPFKAVLEETKAAFTRRGYPDGWQAHFPGGVTGYVVADNRCLTDLQVVSCQAYDWFITLPGVMVEELSLLGENGLEIPSLGRDWPRLTVEHATGSIQLPDLLVR